MVFEIKMTRDIANSIPAFYAADAGAEAAEHAVLVAPAEPRGGDAVLRGQGHDLRGPGALGEQQLQHDLAPGGDLPGIGEDADAVERRVVAGGGDPGALALLHLAEAQAARAVG